MRERDAIHLKGLEFYGYHGVMPEEKVLGQRFIVDVDLYQDLRKPGSSDQVADTINYAEVYQLIKTIVTSEPFHLLERLAEEIAKQMLNAFSCEALRVEIHKPQAPIPGLFEDASVEIWREKTK
ncbi:dihydroneopterin aldolase [Desulfitobacterium sp.]|uniref:dihydroneopterin aldolase n=1 Tax=Desulfitobacterium sp. TaxID=49981 RepID=UPI002CC91318|nr:dihydroneopterin aldolase [Desulfitobacterium sp.]HVJ50491.1 dihydroneopterin aldolase [Desulfitobacterium sp.]